MSSHLLSEIEQTCDSVAILTRGKLVASGPVKDVLATSSGSRVTVKLNDHDQIDVAGTLLATSGFDVRREMDALVVNVDPSQSSRINQALGSQGIWVSELRPDEVTLEDVFLQLTGEPGSMEPRPGHGGPAPMPAAGQPPAPLAPHPSSPPPSAGPGPEVGR